MRKHSYFKLMMTHDLLGKRHRTPPNTQTGNWRAPKILVLPRREVSLNRWDDGLGSHPGPHGHTRRGAPTALPVSPRRSGRRDKAACDAMRSEWKTCVTTNGFGARHSPHGPHGFRMFRYLRKKQLNYATLHDVPAKQCLFGESFQVFFLIIAQFV